jgi:porin
MTPPIRSFFPVLLVVWSACIARPALAQIIDNRKDGVRLDSIATSLPENGDPGGGRKWLYDHGITYDLNYTSEVFSNVSGGIRRGTIFEGLLEGIIDADLEKLLDLKGLSFHANAFQIHGTGGIARDFLGNLNTISNIEALPTTRLSELWLEQKFWDGKASLRFGQLVADSEFIISNYSQLFATSDWPAITKANQPGGGPSYPLSTPGIRLRVDPTKEISFLVALFNGDPASPG